MGGFKCCDKIGLACRFAILALAIAGLVFSVLADASCEYFEFENGRAGWSLQPISGTVGLYRGKLEDGVCEKYPNDANFDGWLTAARATSILAAIGALVGIALLCFECILCRCCGSKIIMNLAWFFAWACQGFTFCIFATEDLCLNNDGSCTLGTGGIYSIVAVCLWLIASCIICCSPKPEPLCRRDCSCNTGDEEEGGSKHAEQDDVSKNSDEKEEQPKD